MPCHNQWLVVLVPPNNYLQLKNVMLESYYQTPPYASHVSYMKIPSYPFDFLMDSKHQITHNLIGLLY